MDFSAAKIATPSKKNKPPAGLSRTADKEAAIRFPDCGLLRESKRPPGVGYSHSIVAGGLEEMS